MVSAILIANKFASYRPQTPAAGRVVLPQTKSADGQLVIGIL
jgi:hypothetical protein